MQLPSVRGQQLRPVGALRPIGHVRVVAALGGGRRVAGGSGRGRRWSGAFQPVLPLSGSVHPASAALGGGHVVGSIEDPPRFVEQLPHLQPAARVQDDGWFGESVVRNLSDAEAAGRLHK